MHGLDPADIGPLKLEDVRHALVRCNRVELGAHALEERPFRRGPVIDQVQQECPSRFRLDH